MSHPFRFVLSILLSACPGLSQALCYFLCSEKSSNVTSSKRECSLWTLQVICWHPFKCLHCIYLLLDIVLFIYCLSPGGEGPCLFLHYGISSAKSNAWHIAGCPQLFVEWMNQSTNEDLTKDEPHCFFPIYICPRARDHSLYQSNEVIPTDPMGPSHRPLSILSSSMDWTVLGPFEVWELHDGVWTPVDLGPEGRHFPSFRSLLGKLTPSGLPCLWAWLEFPLPPAPAFKTLPHL